MNRKPTPRQAIRSIGFGGFGWMGNQVEAWEKIFFFLDEWRSGSSFEGRGKDREAGASSDGDPQTNAFVGEGIKPQALRVRAGLNCAALLKLHHTTAPFSWVPLRCLRLVGPRIYKKRKEKRERKKTVSSLSLLNLLQGTFPDSIEVQMFV